MRAKQSIDRGIPVIARLEDFFWLAKGYSERKELYYFSTFVGTMGEPIGFDELGFGPHGLDLLFIGEVRPVDPREAEMASLPPRSTSPPRYPHQGRIQVGNRCHPCSCVSSAISDLPCASASEPREKPPPWNVEHLWKHA